ncbi:parallel beta-helix repeat protein [Elizabethkingia sp. YR214]|uniref:right-handed parallel beta-helix repeat-containing protein n=1 Tax=Elizabethkingia sp. YR214 TaxID=2135667 RepID=UPI000D3035C5|nr:right-handed parallel beta-helix repeat-containing protein [Elizabethkingia sp. YR214]PUB28532.1 parallel beta-helix repeat protein [Elizabethkingia sp. YR214]
MKYLLGFMLIMTDFLFSQQVVGDTLVSQITPQNVTSINNILKNKINRPQKIIFESGKYYFDNVLSTNSDNILFEFKKGSVIYLKDNVHGFLLIQNDNITVKNLTLIGNGTSSNSFYEGYGILVMGSNNTKIRNSKFSKISGNAIFLYMKGKTGCRNSIIENNIISDPAFNISKNGDESAILLGYSGDGYFHENNIIRKNIIDGNNILKVGIGIIGHGRNNTIENNTISNLLAYGIIAYESKYVDNALNGTKITGNKISNIGEIGNNKTFKGMGIYLQKSHSSLVDSNIITNVLRNSDRSETLGQGAISLGASANVQATNNSISGSEMYGIVAAYADGSKIFNNKISNVRKSGIYLINLNNVIIQKNIFTNIQEVVFKGFFGNTKNAIYSQNKPLMQYRDQNTGHGIIISGNTLNAPLAILNFTGQKTVNNFMGNDIYGNVFKNNIINNPQNTVSNSIQFQFQKDNSNVVKDNKINK